MYNIGTPLLGFTCCILFTLSTALCHVLYGILFRAILNDAIQVIEKVSLCCCGFFPTKLVLGIGLLIETNYQLLQLLALNDKGKVLKNQPHSKVILGN